MFNTNQKPSYKPTYDEPRDQGRIGTVIGEGARIQGTINVSGSLRIDGEIEGGGVVTSDNLSVGAKGSIKGDLTVKHAMISGTVVGKIRARERVELLAGAHVRGDVYAQSFKIEDGVFFHGTCIMGEPAASELEAASQAIRGIEESKTTTQDARTASPGSATIAASSAGSGPSQGRSTAQPAAGSQTEKQYDKQYEKQEKRERLAA
jgi:cytoskeletal protein CcmA (bactofilin family)